MGKLANDSKLSMIKEISYGKILDKISLCQWHFSAILEILCPIFELSLIQQLDLIGKLSQIKLWLRLNAEIYCH
jgi:hypothetical protein